MEGLHVLCELRRPDSVLATKLRLDKLSSDTRGSDCPDLASLFDANGQPTPLLDKDSTCFGRVRLHNLYLQNSQQRKARKSDGDNATPEDPSANGGEDSNGSSKRLPRPPYGKRRSIFYDANAPLIGSSTKNNSSSLPSRFSSRLIDSYKEIDFAIKESAQEIALQSDLMDSNEMEAKAMDTGESTSSPMEIEASNEEGDDFTVTGSDRGVEIKPIPLEDQLEHGDDDERTINSDDVSVPEAPALPDQPPAADTLIDDDTAVQAVSSSALVPDDSVILVSTAMRARQAVVNAPSEIIPVGRYEVATNYTKIHNDIVNVSIIVHGYI
jgi:hypothetical protein